MDKTGLMRASGATVNPKFESAASFESDSRHQERLLRHRCVDDDQRHRRLDVLRRDGCERIDRGDNSYSISRVFNETPETKCTNEFITDLSPSLAENTLALGAKPNGTSSPDLAKTGNSNGGDDEDETDEEINVVDDCFC